MKRVMSAAITILSLLLFLQFTEHANAQNKGASLAKTRYCDPNGFFKIVPPDGWQIMRYPEDPRGKVAFISPDEAELRVLAKGLDYNTFEEMLDDIKAIEKNIGVNTNIEEITFSGNPAVKRTFFLQGNKVLSIDFMIGNTTHNLWYDAPPTVFEKHLSLAQESMDMYEPSLDGVSPEDVKKHAIAHSLRVGQIFIEQGNYDLALEFINEGLYMEPDNPNLLELKDKISGSVATPEGTEIPEESENDEGDDDFPDLAFAVIFALGGAAMITFRKAIAEGTSWPGLAKLTAPIIGAFLACGGSR